jgi:protein O-mannosyl-transferase
MNKLNKKTFSYFNKDINTHNSLDKYLHYLILSGIIIFTLIIYSGTIQNEFTNWDDNVQVESNKDIKSLNTENILKIFSSRYVGMYQPIPTLTYALEYNFFESDPIVYHATNLLFHLFNIILVFLLFFKITKRYDITYLVSILFAVHPMNTESVCWISCRSNLVFTLFYLASLIFYLRSIGSELKDNALKTKEKFKNEKGNTFNQLLINKNYLFSLLLFILSLFSKATAVTLPLVLILLDYYFGKKINLKTLIDKIPFFLFSAVYGILTIIMSEKLPDLISNTMIQYSLFNRIFILMYSVSFYIIYLLAPVKLSAIHPSPQIINGFLPFKYYISPVIIIAFIYLLQKMIKRKTSDKQLFNRAIIFGTLFFLSTISVTLILGKMRYAQIAERYTYIPYLGFFLIIGQFAIYKTKFKFNNFKFIIIILFLLILSVISYERTKAWRSSLTLFNDVVKKYPSASVAMAYNNWGLAKAYNSDYKGAIEDYDKVIKNNPNDEGAINNRGTAKNALGNHKGAILDFNRAIEINPHYAEAYNNRALAKVSLSDNLGALQDYNKAIEIKPLYADAFNNRGSIKDKLGDKEGAIQDYNKAIELDPKSSKIFYNRALAKTSLGDKQGAMQDLNIVLEINPKDTLAYFERGKAKSDLGDMQEAMQDYNKALEINPKYSDAIDNRGIVKGFFGDKQGALEDFNKAIEFNPKNAQAYNNRGNAKGFQGDIRGALLDFNKAIELNPEYAFAFYNRGNAKLFLGDKEGACADWEKAGELGKKEAYNMISKYCK